MATLTTAWADHIYGLVNTGTAPPALTGVYLRLFTDDPTDAGSFADEVTGGSYTGQDISASMDTPTNGVGASDADIVFTDMPAVTVTHWAKCKTATGTADADEMIEFGTLNATVTLLAGEPLTITTGDLGATVA